MRRRNPMRRSPISRRPPMPRAAARRDRRRRAGRFRFSGCSAAAGMTGLPDSYDPEGCARFLRALGAGRGEVLPIAEAALALASFERPRVGLGRYTRHLAALARDVGRHAAGGAAGLSEQVRALNEIILLKYGYSGDELTYDDLQNANLMRVVDRRKGLPVALGILYLHARRADKGCQAPPATLCAGPPRALDWRSANRRRSARRRYSRASAARYR